MGWVGGRRSPAGAQGTATVWALWEGQSGAGLLLAPTADT